MIEEVVQKVYKTSDGLVFTEDKKEEAEKHENHIKNSATCFVNAFPDLSEGRYYVRPFLKILVISDYAATSKALEDYMNYIMQEAIGRRYDTVIGSDIPGNVLERWFIRLVAGYSSEWNDKDDILTLTLDLKDRKEYFGENYYYSAKEIIKRIQNYISLM